MPREDRDDRREPLIDALEVLRSELNLGFLDQAMFREFRDAVLRTEAHDQTWLMHYAGLYWRSQAIRIRRVAQGRNFDASVALTKIVATISSDPEITNRADYVARFVEKVPDLEAHAIAEFDDKWGDGEGAVSREKLKRRSANMMRSIRQVVDLADKVVAHVVEPVAVTWHELDNALAHVADTWNDLYLLLTASSVAFDELYFSATWVEPFTRPLFPSDARGSA